MAKKNAIHSIPLSLGEWAYRCRGGVPRWEPFKEGLPKGEVRFTNHIVNRLVSHLVANLHKDSSTVRLSTGAQTSYIDKSPFVLYSGFGSSLQFFFTVTENSSVLSWGDNHWGCHQVDFKGWPHISFTLAEKSLMRVWTARYLIPFQFRATRWERYNLVVRPSYLRVRFDNYLFYPYWVWERLKLIEKCDSKRTFFRFCSPTLSFWGLGPGVEKQWNLRSFIKGWVNVPFLSTRWSNKRLGLGGASYYFLTFNHLFMFDMEKFLPDFFIHFFKVPISYNVVKAQEKLGVFLQTLRNCISFDVVSLRRRWVKRAVYSVTKPRLPDLYGDVLPFLDLEDYLFKFFEKRVYRLDSFYLDEEVFLE